MAPEIQPDADVKTRILQVARRAFADRGFDGVVVRDLASEAGTTAAMINYYFGGKRALYDAVVADAEQRLMHTLTGVISTTEMPRMAVALCATYFDFLAEERDLQRIVLREVMSGGEQAPELLQRHLLPFRTLIRDVLKLTDDQIHVAISLFGAVAGYFLYEPALEVLLGQSLRSAEQLASRRQHILLLAEQLTQGA